jgi:hypothetical protein
MTEIGNSTSTWPSAMSQPSTERPASCPVTMPPAISMSRPVIAVTSARAAVQLPRSAGAAPPMRPIAAPIAPSTTAVARKPRTHHRAGSKLSRVCPPSRLSSTSRLIAVTIAPRPAPPPQPRPARRPAM